MKSPKTISIDCDNEDIVKAQAVLTNAAEVTPWDSRFGSVIDLLSSPSSVLLKGGPDLIRLTSVGIWLFFRYSCQYVSAS